MDENPNASDSLARRLRIVIIIATALAGMLVVYILNYYPRTDTAVVFANYIGIAPQVDGPITHFYVRENQYVKAGDLLFEIDPRPYQYALERAKSEQQTLEGQIVDEGRTIASQQSGVSVSQANTHSAQADLNRYAAAVDEAQAAVTNAEQGVNRANAEWLYASNNLHRVEPLLTKQYVTVDAVDQARTLEVARSEALKQAQSQLKLAQAQLQSAGAQYERAKAMVTQSQAQLEQSQHAVTTLEPLTAERGARQSAVQTAEYNLNNCKVYAPFDARVTNLILSEGAYAHTGQQIFTLIDARNWWAIGNFRETQLRHIAPGMKADVYVLSRATVRFHGIVDSVGYGVTPSSQVISNLGNGLPDVERTLNWVHLASRYPVRVHITEPASDSLRLGETAVVVIRGY
ncbi:MAG: biotin/lipoyl-binding protein [Candidatus Korobacteraceae bacterium]